MNKLFTFYLFPFSTGIPNGKAIEAETYDEAVNIALEAGYNAYDDYGLTTIKPFYEGLTAKQVHYINRNN